MKARVLALLVLLTGASFSPAAIPGADLLVKLISKEFDTNGDEKIDAGEWQAGCLGGFDQMDANSDGSISVAEIDALKGPIAEELGDFGATVAVTLIKKILLALDKDGDMLISRKEYSDGCEAFFKKLDANGDGQISMAELADMPVKLLQ